MHWIDDNQVIRSLCAKRGDGGHLLMRSDFEVIHEPTIPKENGAVRILAREKFTTLLQTFPDGKISMHGGVRHIYIFPPNN